MLVKTLKGPKMGKIFMKISFDINCVPKKETKI